MRKGLLWAAIIPGGILVVAAALAFVLLLVKLLWAWTIPDLLPGAVAQGLVAGAISWYTAFKVAIFIVFLAALARGRRGRWLDEE